MNQSAKGRLRRRNMRWSILLTLNHARPVAGHESVILEVVQAAYADATRNELRRELVLLHGLGLIELHGPAAGPWAAGLTREGVDVVEYRCPCPKSIVRPIPWWGGGWGAPSENAAVLPLRNGVTATF